MEVPCSSILVRCLPALSCFSEQLVWSAHGVLAVRPCTRPALGIRAVVPGRAAQLSSAFPRLPRVLHNHRHVPKVGLWARAGAAGGAAVAVVAAASRWQWVPETRVPDGFYPIRRWVRKELRTRGYVIGQNLIPIGYVGTGVGVDYPYPSTRG
jgi:hypothetical protein